MSARACACVRACRCNEMKPDHSGARSTHVPVHVAGLAALLLVEPVQQPEAAPFAKHSNKQAGRHACMHSETNDGDDHTTTSTIAVRVDWVVNSWRS